MEAIPTAPSPLAPMGAPQSARTPPSTAPRAIPRVLVLAAALALVALVSACGDQGEREVHRTFDVGPAPSVVIETFGGEVSVEAGADGTVEVIAVLRNPQRIAFDLGEEDGVVTVRAQPTGGFRLGRLTVGAALTVIVPARAHLDITVSQGAVHVTGIRGTIRVRATGSEVVITEVAGTLDIETSKAPIRVVGFTGDASLTTTDASVAVTVASGSFQVSTTNGRIDFDGTLRPGTASTLRTQSAPVSVKLRRADADLDVAAPGGAIDVRQPLSSVVRRTDEFLLATLGLGGATLVVRTTDATVTIGAP